MLCLFFSSRRRHTRCALVTGVQTCALPICLGASRHPRCPGFPMRDLPLVAEEGIRAWIEAREDLRVAAEAVTYRLRDVPVRIPARLDPGHQVRSEERRVGTECVSTCRSRWSP